jgi:amidase
MTQESLCLLDALELSRIVHRREVSCREVMQAYLTRIHRLNPKVNAIVALRPDADLLAEADRCDAELARGESRGWMHGFPHAVKDLEVTAGIATTWGSPLFRDHVPTADGLLVQRIRAAGAIIIGKTNVPEWGFGSQTYNTVYGTTLNPYDLSRTCGGSSGGAAVALALNLLPVADGSDMGGSLRNPAGWCNVFGFRPSQGRVPKWPSEEVFFAQLPTEGPMARNVPDLVALLATIAGPDPRQPLSLPADPSISPERLERDAGHWRQVRIGWLGDFDGHLSTEPGVLELCSRSLGDLSALGCSVEPTPLGFDAESLWRCFNVLRSLPITARFEPHRNDPAKWAQLKPEAQWEYEQGVRLTALEIQRAASVRTAWFEHVLKLFERFDYLALPSAQCFPFDVSQHWPTQLAGKTMDTYHRWMEVMAPVTLAGVPAISVPAGFDARGLPLGLQLFGRPRDDLSVLQLAWAYDQATGWVRQHPPALAGT